MASSSSISAICRNRTGTAGICDDFVQIFGCELTAAVGCQTVVSLLDPEGIDSRIGPLEAVQKILHQRNALRRRQLAGLLAKGLGPLTHDRCS